MPTKSAFSILGLAHKLCSAAEHQGYTPELLNALAEHPTLLGELWKVQMGFSEIKPIRHAVDCDADPKALKGLRAVKHIRGGVLLWGPTPLRLYLSKRQRPDGRIRRILGSDLRVELAYKPVLNANVLDFLLKPENQHLIPDEWKGKAVFFWGTIYRDSDDHLCVRYLIQGVGPLRWSSGIFRLCYYWDHEQPALIRAS